MVAKPPETPLHSLTLTPLPLLLPSGTSRLTTPPHHKHESITVRQSADGHQSLVESGRVFGWSNFFFVLYLNFSGCLLLTIITIILLYCSLIYYI
jgi:hypothetical protein